MSKSDKVLIKNSVNLNIEQSDLIDILIEDKKKELEDSINAAEETLTKMEEDETALIEKLKLVVTKNFKSPFIDDTVKVCKKHDIQFSKQIELAVEGKKIGTYKACRDFKYWASGKKPLDAIKEHTYDNEYFLYIPKAFSIALCIGSNYGFYSTGNIPVEMNEEIVTLQEEQEAGHHAKAKMFETIHNLRIQLLELDSNEKRVKAQFIKASLGKSEEGKHILTMLDQVRKGTKLLS